MLRPHWYQKLVETGNSGLAKRFTSLYLPGLLMLNTTYWYSEGSVMISSWVGPEYKVSNETKRTISETNCSQ